MYPLGRKWQMFPSELGLRTHTLLDSFQDSGLVGLRREYISFLDAWAEILQHAHQKLALANDIKSGTRTDIFYHVDQDALDITISTTAYPSSRMGVDAMAFNRSERLTVHASAKKPWRRKVLIDWLKESIIPDRVLRLHWHHAAHPTTTLLIPLVLSRFYHRA
jgi:hypothetical protein